MKLHDITNLLKVLFSIPRIHQLNRVKIGSGIQLAALQFLLLESEVNWQSDPSRNFLHLQWISFLVELDENAGGIERNFSIPSIFLQRSY